nr:hypothetical protein [uncultured Brevundimonas sp.]
MFAVQKVRDRAGRHVLVSIEGEDATDDVGLFGDDFDQAAGGRPIAVETGAGGQALLRIRGQAAFRLLRQDLDVFGGHEALERNLHARDLNGRHGRDRDAGRAQTIIDVPLMLFVAGEAIFVLDQQDVVFATLGCRDRVQQAGAVCHGLTRDRRVHVGRRHAPAARLRRGGQHLQLVRDRARVLAVVTVSGVESSACHEDKRDSDAVGTQALG